MLVSVALVRSRSSQVRSILGHRGKRRAQVAHVLSRSSSHLLSLQLGKFLSGVLIGFCVIEIFRSPLVAEFITESFGNNPLVAQTVLFVLLVFFVVLLVLYFLYKYFYSANSITSLPEDYE